MKLSCFLFCHNHYKNMAKRSNPYVDDFVPQSKTHVGLKQFNNNEDRMQKVYEKTLQLLFKGARKVPDVIIRNNEISFAKKDTMKQLIIDKDGTLLNSSLIQSVKSSPLKACACGEAPVESQCSYCEVPLCCTCCHLCSSCQLSFCSKCSFIGSECKEICVSCCG